MRPGPPKPVNAPAPRAAVPPTVARAPIAAAPAARPRPTMPGAPTAAPSAAAKPRPSAPAPQARSAAPKPSIPARPVAPATPAPPPAEAFVNSEPEFAPEVQIEPSGQAPVTQEGGDWIGPAPEDDDAMLAPAPDPSVFTAHPLSYTSHAARPAKGPGLKQTSRLFIALA